MSGPGFVVKYSVEDCPPKGKGLVAQQFIPKGTLIWNGDAPGATRILTESQVLAEIAEMDSTQAGYFLNHIYSFNGVMTECIGDAKLWNHSATPNTGSIEVLQEMHIKPLELLHDGSTIDLKHIPSDANYAIRDIHVSEEITDDYAWYDNPQWYIDLCVKYNVEHAGLVAERYS
eukprot:c5698_g1_i1.p1 GENE.c5698_g1_i1~~c5698_g1_i1.p1  ORF type:complete len:186 (-),score=36.77 c5698_g1_i1:7-528(-)